MFRESSSPHPTSWHIEALKASPKSSRDSLKIVARNREELQLRGTFERVLLRAWCANMGTTFEWNPEWIEELFLVHANRYRLRAESDPLPAGQVFQVYRGVAGLGRARRENGLAWTIACG